MISDPVSAFGLLLLRLRGCNRLFCYVVNIEIYLVINLVLSLPKIVESLMYL
uniref:Uncharacterized protein n=1 Tax=Helianthus annuus TaxID=4232 RepID=A0A251T3M3_HELAN